ncbi:DUF7910 domain-containing protein [Anaeromicrobium sediminis]|uniref:Fibronectin type-III domain-containing protein n=1 Tax=Anaeromicrobium sediminis TaxID=1478221 RepID=A0A267MJL5_9FIRM|nr:stalk domain-containing protein [Anaeromicrobium sediminis]PAB59108.1 hypothetical protein CCE28_11355 [Anaeromicrobium sediminis]
MKCRKRFINLLPFIVTAFIMIAGLSAVTTDVYASSGDIKIVGIKAYNGKYLGTEKSGKVEADRRKVERWETFELISLGNNKIAIRGYNGKYLCAEGGGGKDVVFNRDQIREWETFQLVYVSHGKYALKTYKGKYVCAENGGGGKVVANRDKVGKWETFEFVKSEFELPDFEFEDEIALMAENGKYLTAEDGGGEEIIASSSRINSWQKFELIQSRDNKVALKVHNGKYVDVEDKKSGEIEADSSRIDDSTKFQIVYLGNNKIALKGYNGKFLGIEDDDNELMANYDKISRWSTFKLVNISDKDYNYEEFNLRAESSYNGISFRWNDLDESRVIGYNLYRGTSRGRKSSTPITDFPIDGTSYTDKNVEDDTTYYYIMKAVFKDGSLSKSSNEVKVRSEWTNNKNNKIILKVGSKYMTVDGKRREIDPRRGTKMIIKNGRTFLPIRAFIESIGGRVYWDGNRKEVKILVDDMDIRLWIGSKTAKINGRKKYNDVAPYISDSSRTMIPLRFIVENLGCDVKWDGPTQTVEIEVD